MIKWSVIEEYSDSDELEVLATDGEEVLIGYCYWNDYEDKWYCTSNKEQLVNVTHFIPINCLLELIYGTSMKRNWKNEIKQYSIVADNLSIYEDVLTVRDVEICMSKIVLGVLEQIENSSNENLLDLIQKLKKEYKQ